jgi:hypothetical protein
MYTAAERTQRSDPRPDGAPAARPFHAALRAAIRHRGLTLDRLRYHLARRGVTVALSTLSDWQQGNRRPGGADPLRAVRALEEILGLPAESLVRLWGMPHRPDATRPSAPHPPRGLDESRGPIADLLDGLPGALDRGVDIVSSQDRVRVDAERRASLIATRRVVRARRDGVDRYVMRYFGNESCNIDEVQVRVGENCRVGRVLRHPDSPVLVAELLFGEELRAGQTWVFEDQLIARTGECSVRFGTGFPESQEQYLLEVRFDPRTLPVSCHAFARPGLYDEPRRTAQLTLNTHHAVHLLVFGVSAGMVGVEWEWA